MIIRRQKFRMKTSMGTSIILAILILELLFGAVSAGIGLWSFTKAFKKEYAESTYHMADTATTLVTGEHLAAYVEGEYPEEYERTYRYLNTYCEKIHVSLVYIILVDQSDYGRFVSVFNCVNNAVDNTEYNPWELGFQRNTTNEEYRKKYQNIYEGVNLYETIYRMRTTDGQHPHITTMVPVKDSNGKIVAILCMQRPTRELAEGRKPYLRNVLLFTILLAVVTFALVVFYFRLSIVKPIRIVSKEAIRFSKENSVGKSLEHISNFREITDLTQSLNSMENDMVKYMDNLTAITAEKERIATEMTLAARIQEDMLPSVYPAFPGTIELE